MFSEPSFWARLGEFCGAVLGYWAPWVTGIVLVIEQIAELAFPKWWKRLDRRFPKDRRRRALLWLCAVGFIYASFQAFDDVNKRLRETTELLPVRLTPA
jgi:uncharacterized protein YjeT (DUF2065 family)